MNWHEAQLSELALFTSGGTPRKSVPEFWDGEIPWISGSSLGQIRIENSERKVTELGAENGTRIAPAGSTLILVRGMSLLEEIRIGYAARDVTFNQDVKALIARPVLDSRFLTYSLLAWRPQLLSMVHQAGHGTGVLSTDRLKSLTIPYPEIDEQRRIAGVLGAFDDLIETNHALGRALWDAFDVSWKIASEGCSGEIAVRDIATLNKGISYKGEFLSDSGELMVNLANFGLDGRFKKEGTKHYQGPVRTNRTLIRGDLVVANTDLTQRREILGRPVLVPFDNATSTHHTFQVRVSGGEHVRGWLFGALRDGNRRRRLIASSTGTTVAALPPDALLALTIPSAHPPVVTRWWDTAKNLIDAADALEIEAETLGAVRDELLPVLMSGRIAVDEAWEAVS